MAKFKVGDVCEVISVNRPHNLHKVGMECVVLKIEPEGEWPHVDVAIGIRGPKIYTSANNAGKAFSEANLRLKRPPSYPDQFTVGDWDLIPWKPAKERA